MESKKTKKPALANKVKTQDLIIGQEYYFDNTKREFGIFIYSDKEFDICSFKPIKIESYLVDYKGNVSFEYDDTFIEKTI